MQKIDNRVVKTSYLNKYGITRKWGNCRLERLMSGNAVFYSYNVVIAFCDKDENWFLRARRFSNTTSRHLKQIARFVADSTTAKSVKELDEADFIRIANQLSIPV